MIILEEVAKKISNILNKTDDEVSAATIPFDYQFLVETEGFYLDSIADQKTGNNVIPVFISQIGGNFDPVPNLKRGILNIRVDMWFPVSFKKNFYTLNAVLIDVFVARFLNFGEVSGKCLCNVSPFEVGEIQDVDFQQFEQFMGNRYQLKVDKMETYMNMSFTLFLTNCDSSFIYGNNIKYTLTFSRKENAIYLQPDVIPPGVLPPNDPYIRNKDKDRVIPGPPSVEYYAWENTELEKVYYTDTESPTIYSTLYTFTGLFPEVSAKTIQAVGKEDVFYEEEIVWTSSGTGMNNSPMSQQLVDSDRPYTENISNIISYQKSILAYVRDTKFWNLILQYYNTNSFYDLENWSLTKTYEIGGVEKSYTRYQIALSLNENISLGELLTMTISMGDRGV